MRKTITKTMAVMLLLCLCVSLLSTVTFAEGEPVFTQDLKENETVIPEQSVRFAVQADGAESYRWYRNDQPITLDPEKPANIYEFYASPEQNADRIYCIAANGSGETKSKVCTLHVITAPSITRDIPSSLSIEEGKTIALTAEASGDEISCQWYSEKSILTGQTATTLSIPATIDLNGQYIFCQFRNQAGTASTGVCYLTVTAAPTPSPTPGIAPKITKSPTGENVTAGGKAIFIAKADDAESCLWHFYSDDGRESYDADNVVSRFPQLNLSGGKAETLTLTNIPENMNNWYVACSFKNEAGETLTDKAQLHVSKLESKISIINAPRGSTLALEERPDFALSVQATASNGGSFTYQWYVSDTNSVQSLKAIPGATGASYQPERTVGTKYYRVSVRLSQENVMTDNYESDLVAVTFTETKTHEHSFSDIWEHNDISHWHQCTCGEHSDESFHDYSITVLTKPTAVEDGEQKAVCKVCGYESIQTIPAGTDIGDDTPDAPAAKAEKKSAGSVILLISLIVLAAGVIAGAVFLIRKVLREDKED